jgi:hypothetical protein
MAEIWVARLLCEIEDVLFCHELVRACDQHVEHGHATTTQGRRRVAP